MRLGLRAFLLAVACVGALSLPAAAQIEGDYERIGPVPKPRSHDVVLFEEYLNFTCPHCNSFREQAGPLFRKHGKRLQVVHIPILFRGQNDAAPRLFYVAQKEGKEEEIMAALFDATFKYGVNINDPAVVNYLARSAGVGEAYQRNFNAAWVNAKLQEAAQKADQAGITATPTVILQGSLRLLPKGGMPAYIANIDHIISQLLKQ